ncbi:MAG: metallophosphoesterase, partial [Prevotellaceae bacterium]|nr:metallophosphoesterase [Prevotellaceae bacterium]
MDEILIVPDIHGRDFWKPALDYKGTVIFLGDYTDPYDYEGFTQENAYRNLLTIVDFKKQNPERVTLLVGNHELHYYDSNYACGRFDYDYYSSYNTVLTGKETASLFQLCRKIDKYLFIHAGLTKGWYDAHFDEFSKLGDTLEEQLNNLFITNKKAFHEASMHRGGYHSAGSPMWADVSEFSEEPEHVDDSLIQIIGHTQQTGDEPYFEGNIRLLDNRQLYLLKDDEIKKFV